jgi:hypothetical protein
MKRVLDNVRMLALMFLADISLWIAPRTEEGLIWVLGIHATSNEIMRRVKEEHGHPVEL